MRALVIGLLSLVAVSAHAFTGPCPSSLIPLALDGSTFEVNTCGQGNGYTPNNNPGTKQGQDIGFRVTMPAGPYEVEICPSFPNAVVEVRDLLGRTDCNGGVYGAAIVRIAGRCRIASYTGFDAPRSMAILLDSATSSCGKVSVTVRPTLPAE